MSAILLRAYPVTPCVPGPGLCSPATHLAQLTPHPCPLPLPVLPLPTLTGEHPAQLWHAPAQWLPQGNALHAARQQVWPAHCDVCRHARRICWQDRRRAGPGVFCAVCCASVYFTCPPHRCTPTGHGPFPQHTHTHSGRTAFWLPSQQPPAVPSPFSAPRTTKHLSFPLYWVVLRDKVLLLTTSTTVQLSLHVTSRVHFSRPPAPTPCRVRPLRTTSVRCLGCACLSSAS